MDLGAIFDGAVSVYRRYFSITVVCVAVVMVPEFLVNAVLTRRPGGDAMVWGWATFHYLTVFLAGAVAALIVRDVALGARPAVGSILRRIWKKLIPLLLTLVLGTVAMATAALFGIAPGVLIYVWFAFAGQIVVLEDIGYGRALGRSRQLVKRSWWRVFVILLLASFIIELAQTACLIGAQAVAGSGSFVTVAASTAITLLTAPILGLITALLYFDLRLRHDGSDIRAAIRAL
jgi:hypothetical protein